MKGIDIFREIEQIDDKYIEEAQVVRRRSWKSNRNLGSMAAVACMLICVGVYLNNVSMKDGAMEMAARDEAYYVEDTVADYAITADDVAMETVEEAVNDAAEVVVDEAYDDTKVLVEEMGTDTGATAEDTAAGTVRNDSVKEALEVGGNFEYKYVTLSGESDYPTIRVSEFNETSLKDMNFEDLNIQFGVLLEDGRVLEVKSVGYNLDEVYQMILPILEQ